MDAGEQGKPALTFRLQRRNEARDKGSPGRQEQDGAADL